MKLYQLTAAGLLFGIAELQSAAAAEWRFCIAPANAEHRTYITAPFLTATSMDVMESGFHQALDRADYQHDSVQCPTGATEQAVRAMRQHADDFNRLRGNEVVPVEWRPPAGR